MQLSELTEAMQHFVSAKGWNESGGQRPQTPRNLAISLCLEAGEVLEHFQWRDEVDNTQALAGELADVSLYLLQLASVCGIDLEKAIMDKLDVNYGREWEPREKKEGNGS